MLGRFRFLKKVIVKKLPKLEYMEKGSRSSYDGDEAISGIGLFPAVEELWLWGLPKLKGWWKGDDEDDERSILSVSFPRLCQLRVGDCPLLISVPLCPTVEMLKLKGFNEKIKTMKKKGGGDEDGDGQVMDMASSGRLRVIETDDVGYLKSLPDPAAFQFLSRMWIDGDKKVENLREVEDVFRGCGSSLKSLEINYCRKLRSIDGALEHLTALQSLTLYIHEDMLKDEMIRRRIEEEDEIPWIALQHSLHKLQINYMPRGLRHLTSIQSLDIMDGRHIEMIPEWLTSLSVIIQDYKFMGMESGERHKLDE